MSAVVELNEAERRQIRRRWPVGACDCYSCFEEMFAAVEAMIAVRISEALIDASICIEDHDDAFGLRTLAKDYA